MTVRFQNLKNVEEVESQSTEIIAISLPVLTNGLYVL